MRPLMCVLMAATSGNLEHAVAAGRFLPELYRRLRVAEIRTVPLAERAEDIEVLCGQFLARFSLERGLPAKRLSPEAIERLVGYSWPGNVNELEMVLERAVLTAAGKTIGLEAVALGEEEPQFACHPGKNGRGTHPRRLLIGPGKSARVTSGEPAAAPGPVGRVRPLADP